MSKDDFEYFLSLNFQGFPKISTARNLSFDLIAAKHMQYLVYLFYRQYAKGSYNRETWAKLLKETFPNVYTGKIKSIASNFKKENDNSTKYKFEDLALSLPK